MTHSGADVGPHTSCLHGAIPARAMKPSGFFLNRGVFILKGLELVNRRVMGDRVGNEGGFHPYLYVVHSPALWDTSVLQSDGWHPALCGVDPKV